MAAPYDVKVRNYITQEQSVVPNIKSVKKEIIYQFTVLT